MTISDDNIDWSLCTWAGAKRAQLREFLKLTVRERLEAVEQMGKIAEMLKRVRNMPSAPEEVS
jgi:hypothetical protein